MKARRLLTLILGSGLLASQGSFSQMPSQPGTLEIKSEPSGASVTVNGTLVGTPTNTTLVVSPGTYAVSVGAKGTNPYCTSQSVTVQSNETKVLVCNGTRWSAT
jgi:hypothetical protein